MLLNKSTQIAFCGIAAALSLVFMFFAGIVPVATYGLPALAGLPCIVIVVEMGQRWAWPVYAVVCFLSFLLTADKEAVILYILFFGYYPILKATLERIRQKALSWVLKFVVFNVAMVIGFAVAVFVMGIPKESFLAFGSATPLALLAAGNVVFFLYDYTLTGLVADYCRRFHPMVGRWLSKK